jgi:hypothetical protein
MDADTRFATLEGVQNIKTLMSGLALFCIHTRFHRRPVIRQMPLTRRRKRQYDTVKRTPITRQIKERERRIQSCLKRPIDHLIYPNLPQYRLN